MLKHDLDMLVHVEPYRGITLYKAKNGSEDGRVIYIDALETMLNEASLKVSFKRLNGECMGGSTRLGTHRI